MLVPAVPISSDIHQFTKCFFSCVHGFFSARCSFSVRDGQGFFFVVGVDTSPPPRSVQWPAFKRVEALFVFTTYVFPPFDSVNLSHLTSVLARCLENIPLSRSASFNVFSLLGGRKFALKHSLLIIIFLTVLVESFLCVSHLRYFKCQLCK